MARDKKEAEAAPQSPEELLASLEREFEEVTKAQAIAGIQARMEEAKAEIQQRKDREAQLAQQQAMSRARVTCDEKKGVLADALADGAKAIAALIESWSEVGEAQESLRSFEGEKKGEGLVTSNDRCFESPYEKPQTFRAYFDQLLKATVDPGRVGNFGNHVYIREVAGDYTDLQDKAQ